ncbi:hypothetical protein CAPTEDRAFT_227075 [Capitella teleta]|uniref:Uncharacterized protein n=1 Tax=Capitella teleta TaxID=283909 RepID=R7TIE5_CAPTE|nr:hypothetical protein CAPTEDRAFT_227075 [Capitella teleta]|eukprot:ELT93618.1 hypothetical protein CAPTEDRAFT_227075 [Capitella teleta]
MADVKRKTLEKDIEEILKGADLSTLSVKKIRKRLEEKHDANFTQRKDEIDKMVMAALSKKEEDNMKEEEEGDDSDFEKPEDYEPSAKRTKRGEKKTKSKSDDGSSPKRRNGYMKECILSPALADVMGTDRMARSDVVKRMWEIVRERELQDPKQRQYMRCDEQLQKVFGRKRVRTFGMMKYLTSHITKAE